jgi:hypothetical protein
MALRLKQSSASGHPAFSDNPSFTVIGVVVPLDARTRAYYDAFMFTIIGGDQQEYGPITPEQLKQWIAEGRANGQTMVQMEGTQGWRPLSTFPELAAFLVSTATLPPPVSPSSDSASDPVSTVIPYKNMPALISYYLAVFSLIPCLGIPLGLAAVVLGVIGLKRARHQPEVRGKVHAWFGIILGGLFGFGYLIVLTLMIAKGLGSH